MKSAAQLQATIELLDEVTTTRYPADRVMARYFKQRRYIGAKDKAVISEQLYTVLRNRLRYEFLLERAGLGVNSRLLAALMIKLQGENLAAYFVAGQYSPVPLRAEQCVVFDTIETELESAPQYVRLNVPQWMTEKLYDALGERFEVEMYAANQRASTDIRVNLLKTTVSQVCHVLSESGYVSSQTVLSPWGIRFEGRVALFGLDIFKQGWFEVQDEGSQLLALLSGVKAGDKVVDFCAGAGGKTLALAAMMENKGVIYACDVHSKRLEQLVKRSKRAGVHNVRTHVLSSEHDKWVKKHQGIADTVLIDAPCTGTGTWRRSPDSRWNLTRNDLANLVKVQHSILQSAQRLVSPGGRLLYATCSLLNEENEQQVEQFLSENNDFVPCDLPLPTSLIIHQSCLTVQRHQLRTFPGLTGTDGFFVASLMRKEDHSL